MGKGTQVIYIGESYKVKLRKGQTYVILDEENGWIQVVNEMGDKGYYPSDEFEIIAA